MVDTTMPLPCFIWKATACLLRVKHEDLIAFQAAVEQLIADVASLAAPSSLFYFDFLHLDVLEGRTEAVGYANTAKASCDDD